MFLHPASDKTDQVPEDGNYQKQRPKGEQYGANWHQNAVLNHAAFRYCGQTVPNPGGDKADHDQCNANDKSVAFLHRVPLLCKWVWLIVHHHSLSRQKSGKVSPLKIISIKEIYFLSTVSSENKWINLKYMTWSTWLEVHDLITWHWVGFPAQGNLSPSQYAAKYARFFHISVV